VAGRPAAIETMQTRKQMDSDALLMELDIGSSQR
jgi:hypothetical protein